MGNKFILTVLSGGPGYTLDDNDLWGLESALTEGLQNGYLEENREWAETMLERIGKLRDYDPGKVKV